MRSITGRLTFVAVAATSLLAWSATVATAQSPAGVVTLLQGTANNAKAAAPQQPVALKFRDPVDVNDRITTGDQSLVRMLLGGKAVVTVRERSTVTVTDLPQQQKSIVDVSSGRIGLSVAREKMRTGDSIEVRTPNALAGVRGTTIIVDVSNATAQATGTAPASVTTTILNLTGTSTVQFYEPVRTPSAPGAPGIRPVQGNVQLGPPIVLTAGMFAARTGLLGAINSGNYSPGMLQQQLSGLTAALTNVQGAGQGPAKEQAVIATTQLVQVISGGGLPPQPLTTTALVTTVEQRPQTEVQDAIQQQQVTENRPPPPPPPPPGNGGTTPPPVLPFPIGTPIPGFGEVGQGCDDCSSPVALGFAFPFRGTRFTSAELSSNGFLLFGGTAGATSFNPSVPSLLSGLPSIRAAWTDHDLRLSDAAIRRSAGPGSITFTYDRVGEFSRLDRNNTFQIQLRADGTIVMAFGRVDIQSHDVLVGVTGGNGATDPGPSNFRAVPFHAPSGTAYEVFSPGDFDLEGRVLVFTPDGEGGFNISSGASEAVLTELVRIASAAVIELTGLSTSSPAPLYTLSGGLRDRLPSTLARIVDSSLTLPAGLFRVEGGSELVSPATDPLVWLSASRIATTAALARLHDSDIVTAGSFLRLDGGSQIVQTGVDPMVLVHGGSLVVGTDAVPGSVFELMGRESLAALEPSTGQLLGRDRLLQPAADAPVLSVDGGADVRVGGNLYKVDTALLEATAPLLRAVGHSSVTVGGHAVDLHRSRLGIAGDVAMAHVDASALNVLNGHLLNASASRVNIAGDLLHVSNGGLVNLLNGVLLNVSGGSMVAIDGSLVHFSGTGGNRLNVTNTLAPTMVLRGVPIHVASGAIADVSLGAGALSGLRLGRIMINGVRLTRAAAETMTGSLISVQGAGGTISVGGR